MPDFPFRELIQQYPRAMAAVLVFFVLLVVGALLTTWLIFGRGPRRRRSMRAARKVLKAGNWKGALEQLKRVRGIGSPSSSWTKRFNEFEAECLQQAAIAAVANKEFELALEYRSRAAEILGLPVLEDRMGVQAAMLQEIRRLFSKQGETRAVTELIGKTLLVQSPCPEASFWQALCDIRKGAMETALTNLQVARTGIAQAFSLGDGFPDPPSPGGPAAPESAFIDPPLYLGALLLRLGQAKEALRFLTEANRMDANCPFITLQLGAAIVAAGGDTNMAVRALQRALGPKGLGQWQDNPQKAWVEGMPESRSYVRKLASAFPFSCPLFGEDLKYLIRQGNLALAQGHFKLNNLQEAAELFDRVLKEGAPSLAVLRGLGLSLAKLERYDDAFVHLRTAHEREEDKDRLTAGYLALCGASGKPARPEDKLQNIAWAIRLVTQFNAPGNAEWIGILNRIFAEARQCSIPLTSDDQLYLCEHLVSLKSCDVLSAQAYHHLMKTEPRLVHPEYAWLYCRADQLHDVGGEESLALYHLTFGNPGPAAAFFSEQGWSFEDVERKFLSRTAEKAPGRFPEILGVEYPQRGEELLLAHSATLEAVGNPEAALQDIETLVRLSPQNTSATDRAAALHFHAGRAERARELLQHWQQIDPANPMPLVRQALLEHQQGRDSECFDKLRQAMTLVDGRRRANIAFLGARVALRTCLHRTDGNGSDELNAHVDVHRFLDACLANDPTHAEALWCRASLKWLQGDAASLADQSSVMTDRSAKDVRYHYLAALCHLLAKDYESVLKACERVVECATEHAGRNGGTGPLSFASEAGYVAALAHLELQQRRAAIDALKPLARTNGSPTLAHAQALLGNVLFQEGRHEEAVQAWQTLETSQKQVWNLSEPVAQTLFINALESLQGGAYEQAADTLRQAGRLGCRDRRLGPLLLLALFKAGQQAIYAGETAPVLATSSG